MEKDSVEETWKNLKETILEAMVKKEIRWKRRKIGHKEWWNKSCSREKRKVHRALKSWKKGKITRDVYLECKSNLKEFLDNRYAIWKEEEELELKNLRNATEVWKYINKRKGRRKKIKNSIGKREWERHFKNLLEGSDRRGNEVTPEEVETEEGNEKEEGVPINEELIRRVDKLKNKKAPGLDGIPMEAWKYGGAAIRKGLTVLIKKIWLGDSIPEDWKTSVILPLYKKGDQEKTKNYRGISLLCSAYKIYATVLRGSLEEESMELKALPESQGGFREGRGTMENIFILNHVVQREKLKEDKKVFALFVDLKAAFDNIKREKLWHILEEIGIKKQTTRRLKKVYEETKAVVKTEDGVTKEFHTCKGVRQGCVMSPLLFDLYIADIDKYMSKRGIGGIKLGNDRIWSLAYADDMVLLAKNRVGLMDMMDTLRRFLKEKGLELNIDKTKVMIFNRNGKEKIGKWLWEGRELEEVSSFKYLGFVFNRKGDYRNRIKDLSIKGRLAANRVWGLGERICNNDFSRRWMLFCYLIKSVMSYGVEIWGWEEKKELEKVMLDYVRWVFNIDFCTPRYIMMLELGLDKLRIKWGIRARRFEEKIKAMEDYRWVKLCWNEKRKFGWNDLYGKERERYYNRNGWSSQALEGLDGDAARRIGKELEVRDKDVQVQELESKLSEARYNKRYAVILDRKIRKPKYLSRKHVDSGRNGIGIRVLARFRCGNMEEDNKYWLSEVDRECVFCCKGKDNLNHFVEECEITRSWFVTLGRNRRERIDKLLCDDFDDVKKKVLLKFWFEKKKAFKACKEKIR